MPAAKISFTPHRDAKGYRLIPGKVPPRRPGQSELRRILDARMDELEPPRIKSVGGKLLPVPFDQYPLLFGEFARIRSAEELLGFITEFGPLTIEGTAKGPGDNVPHLLDQAKWMREELNRRDGVALQIPITNLKAWVSKDQRTGAVTVKTEPETLLGALWLQLGHVLSGGMKMKTCRHCGERFPVGGDTGRRVDATFCTAEHKKRFFSLKRSKRK
jgi:hypothetical protein